MHYYREPAHSQTNPNLISYVELFDLLSMQLLVELKEILRFLNHFKFSSWTFEFVLMVYLIQFLSQQWDIELSCVSHGH